jgi:hypothetical protein
MPAFGLLGIDFGHGFDAGTSTPNGNPLYYWTTILVSSNRFSNTIKL